MILNSLIIDAIKKKSGLCFDKAKDYDILCDKIFSSTNRTIGVNTIKRLMGYIVDDRKTNEYGSVVILGGLTFVNFPLCIHLC